MSMKTYRFYTTGMHCKACEALIESELGDIPAISMAKADLATREVEVTGDFGSKTDSEVEGIVSGAVSKHGYGISKEKRSNSVKWSDFKIALPLALGFAALFVILQKIGLVNLVNSDSVTLGTSFAIGIIASLSTCMAVVGGLVLSMSATFAKAGDKTRPQVLFHIGRLVAFFVLGGVIGAIGSAFALGATGTFVLSLLIGLVMLVVGVNLLDVFEWPKRLLPSMPKALSGKALDVSKWNHRLTPLALGVATFFLPCGFTQSMQIYSLSTGSFLSGGLTMLSFALGTLPVLALVSFSSLSIGKGSRSGIFFKTAGLVIVMFALLNLLSSFAAIGVIPPILNL
ncbi:MAG: sulfite exporter TauE/SafE family protein [Candidatus Taylorbacteria bacterium]|nr:sulfite exporter TauE/SafE family protein [Candidatus Taylorbacteria bacterium]